MKKADFKPMPRKKYRTASDVLSIPTIRQGDIIIANEATSEAAADFTAPLDAINAREPKPINESTGKVQLVPVRLVEKQAPQAPTDGSTPTFTTQPADEPAWRRYINP
jgi:hypothetical protein